MNAPLQHCSALVKPSEDGRDLFTSHVTWTSYSTMLRMQKRYRFKLCECKYPGHSYSMSSYPGLVPLEEDELQARCLPLTTSSSRLLVSSSPRRPSRTTTAPSSNTSLRVASSPGFAHRFVSFFRVLKGAGGIPSGEDWQGMGSCLCPSQLGHLQQPVDGGRLQEVPTPKASSQAWSPLHSRAAPVSFSLHPEQEAVM